MKRKIRNKNWLVLIGLGLAFTVFANGAHAVLEVTFKEGTADKTLNINQIQYYWSTDASRTANVDGRTINPDPNITFNLDVADGQAKAYATPPTSKYIFGADDAHAGSQTIYIRAWNGVRQTDDVKYSIISGLANSSGSGKFETITLTYPYIKAAPGKGEIYKAEESTVKTLPATVEKKIKVYSRQMAVTGGIVEVASYQWKINQNGIQLTDVNGGADLELSNPGYTISPGDVFKFQVRDKNLWDVYGDWSDEYSYTYGAGVPLLSAIIIFESGVATNKFGLNFFAMPFSPDADGKWWAFKSTDGSACMFNNISNASTNEITTAYDLVMAINSLQANSVSTFGYWNKAAAEQKVNGVMVSYDNGFGQRSINTTKKLEDMQLKTTEGYQVYLTLPAGQKVELLIKNGNKPGL